MHSTFLVLERRGSLCCSLNVRPQFKSALYSKNIFSIQILRPLFESGPYLRATVIGAGTVFLLSPVLYKFILFHCPGWARQYHFLVDMIKIDNAITNMYYKKPLIDFNELFELGTGATLPQCSFSGLQNWEGNFLQHAEILPQAANNHSYFFLKSNFTQ